jgi:uncharacterized protein
MKRIFICVAAFLLSVLLVGQAMAKAPMPGRTKNYVNDYAGILDKDTIDYLEKLNESLKDKSKDRVELIITTFKSIDGWWFQDFAMAYGEKWRAAKKFKRDNGVMIIAVIDDDRIAIGVGDNLKDILYQRLTDNILNGTLRPEFKEKRYSEGIKKAADELVGILNEAEIPKNDIRALFKPIGIAVLVIGALVIIILPLFRKKK